MIILFDRKIEGRDGLQYQTVTDRYYDQMRKFMFAPPQCSIWHVNREMWAGLDLAGDITFDSVDQVQFSHKQVYVYVIPCRQRSDINSGLFLRMLPGRIVQQFADFNVNILYDYSLEMVDEMLLARTDEIYKYIKVRNNSYTGKIIVSSCSQQDTYSVQAMPDWATSVALPGWFNKAKFDFSNNIIPDESIIDRYISTPKDKLFLNLNRAPRIERAIFLHGLKCTNLIDHGLVSHCVSHCDLQSMMPFPDRNKAYFFKILSSIHTDNFLSVPRFIDDVTPDDNLNITYRIEWVDRICLEVVSESPGISHGRMQCNSPTLTEKIVKTLWHGLPFMINGAAGTLSRLKSLGFKSFPYLFDEQYDEMPDIYDRQECIINNLLRWVGREKQFMEIMSEHKEDLVFNHHHAKNFPASKYYLELLTKSIS